MLFPKKTKYRKLFKGRVKGDTSRGALLNYGYGSVISGISGCYGLKAMTPGRVTAREIESARKAIMKRIKRVGRFWIRVFPDVPVTSKPAEVRMGSGKGDVDRWVCRVHPGRVLFEMDGVKLEDAREAFALAASKLSVNTKFVSVLDSGMLVG
jgi:large subunit ribosomal protein L16